MAHITLAGVLLDPTGEFAVGDKVRFTHKSTTGETIMGAISVLTVPPNGAYSIDLEYGLVFVEYMDYRRGQWCNLGVATVNATNPATSIPELLNALVPVSSAELIEFQAILADCVTAQTAAENAATTAEAFAYQLTTTDLIASSATFTASTTIPTSGFFTSGDGGGGSWIQNGVTGQTPSQTPAQIGDILLNDANGVQWELSYSGTVESQSVGLSLASADNGPVMRALHSDRRAVSYPYGQINVTGTVEMPFGTAVRTAGYGTEFWFSGMTESTDCFEVVRGGAGFERRRNLFIGMHKIVLVNSNCRYGISTPVDADVFLYEKAFIEVYCMSMASDRAATVTPYSAAAMLRIGDCIGGKVELYGSGGFDYFSNPAGQRISNGIQLEGETGNIGVKMKVEYLACHTGLDIRNGTEGFQIEGEFVGCINGIDTINQTIVEPGGFIDNMHVNASNFGYRLNNRAELSIGAATAYKSDSFYDDGTSLWVGFEIGTSSSVRIGEVGCFPGSSFNKVRNTALIFRNGSYESSYTHLDSRNCGTLTVIDNSKALMCGSNTSVNGLTGYDIRNTPSATLGPIIEHVTPLITDFVVMEAGVDRQVIRGNQRTISLVNFEDNGTLSSSGTTTLKPINNPVDQRFGFSSGTYEYDIILDEDVSWLGCEFNCRINLPSNVNTVVNFKRKSGLLIKSYAEASAAIYLVRFLFTGSNTYEIYSELVSSL